MPEIEKRTMDKVAWRLVPFLMLCYFVAYLDRVNIGFAGALDEQGPRLSRAAAFGGAAGIFFIAYFFFEVPSNLALDRFGARLWIARIMLTWGVDRRRAGLRLRRVQPQCRAPAARRRRGRLFPRHHFLPDAVVSRRLSRANRRLVHVRHSDLDGDRRADFRASSSTSRRPGPARLAMDVHHRSRAGDSDDRSSCSIYLTDRPRDAHWLEPQESGSGCRISSTPSAPIASGTARCRGSARCSTPRVIALGFVYMGCNIPAIRPELLPAADRQGVRRPEQRPDRLHHRASLCGRRDRHDSLEPSFRRDERAQMAHGDSAGDHRHRAGGSPPIIADAVDQDDRSFASPASASSPSCRCSGRCRRPS